MGLGKTLAELESMTAEELTGWYAFYQLEPWGCLVEDHRTELGLNLLFNINAKKGSKAPRFIERDPQRHQTIDPTPEELDENIKDFFMGKTVRLEADEVIGEEVVEVATLPAPGKTPRKPRTPKKAKPTK
ncbi:hypothetical protein SAMN05192583_0073 [Sphingomonas gellani]|uniref:Minor tail T domain-containing protein n=1 Tax=Sphingomonas gellani TaxID=1166340 RepID=A0A1H7Y5H4_9SPHN|nr:hypothetical protein [Sphingomonas gellani]SEM40568.1 hypothetical protein SAMN05192583_0073 [Sphingomonas gellani]